MFIASVPNVLCVYVHYPETAVLIFISPICLSLSPFHTAKKSVTETESGLHFAPLQMTPPSG